MRVCYILHYTPGTNFRSIVIVLMFLMKANLALFTQF